VIPNIRAPRPDLIDRFNRRRENVGDFFIVPDDYQLVPLAGSAKTLFSAHYGEKMHPGLGPQAEADLLYVQQLRIVERLQQTAGDFVIWDVGLGAAANAIAALNATRHVRGRLHLISFDNTAEPLEFARAHAGDLGYLAGYERQIDALLADRRVEFKNGESDVCWEFHLGDFPDLLHSALRTPHSALRSPHAIFFDAFSPAKNPAMWTLAVFQDLFQCLDSKRPCALTTYSRSTMLRATLLLAGFFVGAGEATGLKEETTVAANHRDLVPRLLDARWLARASRSDSAEPLPGPVYRRAKLLAETLEKLRQHPQFQL